MRRSIAATIMALLLTWPTVAAAQARTSQPNPGHDRAVIQVKVGWENMRAEKFEEAARDFQEAINLDPNYADAHYSLGRADMALKKFPEAIVAYTRARGIYESFAGQQFTNAQDNQRRRKDQIVEIDERIRQLQTGPQTPGSLDQLRQAQDFRRRLEEDVTRGNNMTIENSVPAWVLLALGSAHFRAGHMLDAEREYKAAIAADPKAGEAHQNLAVVYMTLQRYGDAERALAAAKKTGFKVNPALEQELKEKKKGV
jgi:tetratricopeptide (TPR) repeat protein